MRHEVLAAHPDGEVLMSTTPEGDSLLEQLRAAYQGLSREEQRQVKRLLVTLSGSNSNLLCRKERTNQSGAYGKKPVLQLSRDKDTIESQVTHDSHNRPCARKRSGL